MLEKYSVSTIMITASERLVRIPAKIWGRAAGSTILLNTIDGVRGIDPTLVETARSYGMRSLERIRRVVLPAALPQIFAGMRTSLSLAVIIMVLTEYFSSTSGVGYVLLISKNTFQLVPMWAAILLIGLLGYLLNVLLLLFERRVLRWHRGWRAVAAQ